MPTPKEITLAPQDRLATVEHLAPRFFREVLRRDHMEHLVADGSDLYDFAEDEVNTVETMLDRMRAHYFIDGGEANSTRVRELLGPGDDSTDCCHAFVKVPLLGRSMTPSSLLLTLLFPAPGCRIRGAPRKLPRQGYRG